MPIKAVIAVFVLLGATFAAAEEIDFTRNVRPILSENCFHCHGPDPKARKGKLQLDEEQDVKRDQLCMDKDWLVSLYPKQKFIKIL